MPFLIHVSIPPKKEDRMVSLFEENEIRSVNRLQGASSVVFIFRLSDTKIVQVLKALDAKGVGVDFGIVNIMRLEATKPPIKDDIAEESKSSSSVASRLPTELIYADTLASATLTFDYVAFIIVASVLAGIGLATNSSVIVVASMLVSPLMGPITSMTFGVAVRDKKLVKMGLLSEFVGVVLCFVIGFLVAVSLARVGRDLTLPTKEMTDRGQWMNLLFGVAIAFFSGIGVALSIAGGAISSLVGVAISASILPPVVNCGLLFGLAVTGPSILPDFYRPDELFRLSGISFLLWFVNFGCIVVAGLIIFKLKQVSTLPMRGSIFWAELNDVMQKAPGDRPWNRPLVLENVKTELDGSLRARTSRNYASPQWRQDLANRLTGLGKLDDETAQKLRDYTTSVL